ncbi:MAG: hypothetical protein MUD10_00945 [Candidatus Pacebacteria bacterium]|nr:hypothetical protein [Candidatus Paceibacterota bacterium]
MQIRLTRYDYCPDNDTLGGRRLLGISDLDKKVVTFEGRDGSWVIDMDRDEAAGAIMLWNTQIETGEIKSPVGSHYVTGPASRSIPGDVGIYFVDSTKI